MSVGLYLLPTLDVQSAASSSADRVPLRCSQAHQAFCFYSVWFHIVFPVMSFLSFLVLFKTSICSKRQPRVTKLSARDTIESCKNKKQRSFTSSLIWSLWCVYVILFNKSAWVLTALTDFETRSETHCVFVRFNVSESWTAELTLFSCRDSAFSLSRHFPWQPAVIPDLRVTVGVRMIADWPSKTLVFLSPWRWVSWCVIAIFMF